MAAGPLPPASVGPCGDVCQAEQALREGSEEEGPGITGSGKPISVTIYKTIPQLPCPLCGERQTDSSSKLMGAPSPTW